jgi:hypothetical protein
MSTARLSSMLPAYGKGVAFRRHSRSLETDERYAVNVVWYRHDHLDRVFKNRSPYPLHQNTTFLHAFSYRENKALLGFIMVCG